MYVINLEFIIYLITFQFHFYLSLFHTFYFVSILAYISCIVWKIQVMDPLHIDDLFITDLWTLTNSIEVVVHYLLVEGMIDHDHQDEFPIVSELVCMINYTSDMTYGQL